MVRKIIEVKRHPYMWKVQVTFGTLEDMLKNRYRWQKWNGIQVHSISQRNKISKKHPLFMLGRNILLLPKSF